MGLVRRPELYFLKISTVAAAYLAPPPQHSQPHPHFWELGRRQLHGEVPCRVPHFPGLSRDFDCFDFILEWDGMSGMEVVFDSLIVWRVLIV